MIGPRSAGNHGFSLIELMATMSVIGIASVATVPTISAALHETRLIAATDIVVAQVRSARLAAVSGNRRIRIVFDCPTTGAVRNLAVTGDPSIDDAADRCASYRPDDGALALLPAQVTFGAAPTLEFNGRGIVTAADNNVPASITVSHDHDTRTLLVTATGRVTKSASQ